MLLPLIQWRLLRYHHTHRNFNGDLMRDVTGENCSFQLLLATVDDVPEVFGSSYRDEAKFTV
ncbi:hypothetical protein GN244_ATG16553 [Phytophthora infestans]|uniref:Uncharacterized protein n=1 Tax=Phytophthora infestans TaxID=4787 RepID=A0A833VWD2_PHYIN|nr:hypothetical protein GN244_ATG16553 [Phytophthora infestans]